MLDPKKGYFSMANNKFVSDNYKHRSSLQQLTTGRSWVLDKLIQEKIQKKEKFTFDNMKEMQQNVQD